MENSRRGAWSSGTWVLPTDRQTTRVGTPEIIVGWGKTQPGPPAPRVWLGLVYSNGKWRQDALAANLVAAMESRGLHYPTEI